MNLHSTKRKFLMFCLVLSLVYVIFASVVTTLVSSACTDIID